MISRLQSRYERVETFVTLHFGLFRLRSDLTVYFEGNSKTTIVPTMLPSPSIDISIAYGNMYGLKVTILQPLYMKRHAKF